MKVADALDWLIAKAPVAKNRLRRDPPSKGLWCHVKDYEIEGKFIGDLINASALKG